MSDVMRQHVELMPTSTPHNWPIPRQQQFWAVTYLERISNLSKKIKEIQKRKVNLGPKLRDLLNSLTRLQVMLAEMQAERIGDIVLMMVWSRNVQIISELPGGTSVSATNIHDPTAKFRNVSDGGNFKLIIILGGWQPEDVKLNMNTPKPTLMAKSTDRLNFLNCAFTFPPHVNPSELRVKRKMSRTNPDKQMITIEALIDQ